MVDAGPYGGIVPEYITDKIEDKDAEEFDPSLPYNGTEGYSGSDTSRERAITEALEGIASKRQRYILILIGREKEKGLTVAEIRDPVLHHGRVSGSLSVLHKEGRIVRLKEKRQRCHVYVLPEYVGERDTEPFGGKAKPPTTTYEEWGVRAKGYNNEDDDSIITHPGMSRAEADDWHDRFGNTIVSRIVERGEWREVGEE